MKNNIIVLGLLFTGISFATSPVLKVTHTCTGKGYRVTVYHNDSASVTGSISETLWKQAHPSGSPFYESTDRNTSLLLNGSSSTLAAGRDFFVIACYAR